MFNEKRTIEEILAITKLVPTENSIFVEGLDDKLFIEDYLKEVQKKRVAVYGIDEVDFDTLYASMPAERVKALQDNNKDRVVLLAEVIESALGQNLKNVLCIVDLDMDRVLGREITRCYLTYTDYASMELYLMNEPSVSRILTRPLRITKPVDVSRFLESLASVCRQIFHIRCLLHVHAKEITENDKDLSFDKKNFVCSLNLDSYWQKNILQKGLDATDSKTLFDTRMSRDVEKKTEIRGHDFVHCFFYFAKKYKDFGMNEKAFSDVIWGYVDYPTLVGEPLFKRISSL